jgi:hypothetical protein
MASSSRGLCNNTVSVCVFGRTRNRGSTGVCMPPVQHWCATDVRHVTDARAAAAWPSRGS